jgi:Fe-S-cluster-containing hydrogenase component 2
VLSYIAAGNYIPDISLLAANNTRRNATARAAILTEAISLDLGIFKKLLARNTAVKVRLQRQLYRQFGGIVQTEGRGYGGLTIVDFIGKHGLGEATNVLLIDETLCVGCDNCEKACAETHHGISRLDREAGPTFAAIHVPTSCRHCEHPHCMKDCPPDALSRQANGEILIDNIKCIGCGNCERNCPYGVIRMATQEEEPRTDTFNLLTRLLFGEKRKTAEQVADDQHVKKAVKCDMCRGLPGGPACVRSCPTGAAIRVTPQQFMEVVQKARAAVKNF